MHEEENETEPLELHMVDISGKRMTHRSAIAEGCLRMQAETLAAIRAHRVPKGDPLAVAEVAGVMAAKQTPQWIPLAHPIPLTHVGLHFEFDEPHAALQIRAEATADYATGVEMEALCAVTAAALAIYDMCKGIDKTMVLDRVHLVEKHGGKSGDFFFPEEMRG
ncbi:MAG: cyclic pyranopterin monophosphate synthase MoaC [Firmicutes bacterium]|nr:cyclic pyranopterin monophosphate synthase MoaC [Bacillota bacterium]